MQKKFTAPNTSELLLVQFCDTVHPESFRSTRKMQSRLTAQIAHGLIATMSLHAFICVRVHLRACVCVHL